jgi:2,3-bisphosphoglycerate-independent phosphoglycerate mutase
MLFLDGVGIGPDDPAVNPLAAGEYPVLRALLGGRQAAAETGRLHQAGALLAPVDAQMGVPGRPQSATGQAALLTGLNAPRLVGEHYGPRPDDRVRALVDQANLFTALQRAGCSPFFCNAYPQGYFDAVARGKRLLSVIPYAATQAGQALPTAADLYAGRALAADFTAAGWRDHLGDVEAPVLSPVEAGRHLWRLGQAHDFVLFEHWLTDVLGHHQRFDEAVENFGRFDAFLGGLIEAADLSQTMILVTSDHGNVEDCSHGKHTENPALSLVIGAGVEDAWASLWTLADVAPLIMRFLAGESAR